jgi:hypothetical protein
MRADDRFFGAGLRETQTSLSSGLELATKDAFGEKPAKKGEHGDQFRVL